MPLKVILPDSSSVAIHSSDDFERVLKVRYLNELEFGHQKIRHILEKKVERALSKDWITAKQKWLGHYFAKQIRGDVPLDLNIAWIDEHIGYGVWTNRDIAPKEFIGVYSGLVHKRRLFRRWENRYCFDYTTGPHRSTSLVIDSQDAGNHIRFINHSFRPNLDLTSVYFDGKMQVILTANRAIAAGQQLTYDYGTDYWEKRGKPKGFTAR